MVNYIIEDSKTFKYYTDSETQIEVFISVYEFNNIIYSTNVNIVKNITYFTTLTRHWNDRKVIILDKSNNQEISFNIKGVKYNHQQKLDKCSKYLILDKNDTELCDIMNKCGSDKATTHNYTKYYTQIFEKIKYDEINIFELGIGTNNSNFSFNMGENGIPGASIFGWNEYFKNGHIFGADIDTTCLFNTDEIKTFYCDQTNPWIIKQMWNNKYLNFKFDIIIEDGYHMFDANVTFFENSYHKLKKHGIFIIEDIDNNEIPNWINKFEEYEKTLPQFNFEIIMLEYNNRFDNNLIKITNRHEKN